MALGKKAKKFIVEQYPGMPIPELAERFNVPEQEIEEVINAHKSKETEDKEFSLKKKITFYAITIAIPFLFFLGLEGTLRLTNYMGTLDLFEELEVYDKTYMIPNSKFAARYFFYTNTIPTPPVDAFLKEKPDNGFRVFAMGGSSAAGYPYGYNITYSRLVRDVLQDAMPSRKVEVVNVATSAINTYTLYDQTNEILEYEPDAIIIYAGHNEFYGAFGVGSNETLGGFPAFVRSYLGLQRIKTFLLLRNMMVSAGKWISEIFTESDYDPSSTLMERIVAERSIPLEGPTYDMAMKQFKSNMNEIIATYTEENIPVFVGSIISNLKDHKPFESIEEGGHPPADAVYQDAKQSLASGDSAKALEEFDFAKDLDALKFRAPSEINSIIQELTQQSQVYYVPVKEEFLSRAKYGIPGNDLFLEHLHPNTDGYFLLGKAFAQTMMETEEIPLGVQGGFNLETYNEKLFTSEYEERIGYHRIKILKNSWPFVKAGEKKEDPYRNYEPRSKADSLAFLFVNSDNIRWEKAKLELAAYYKSQNKYDKAMLQYKGLIRNQPWNDSPYLYAARSLLDRNKLNEAAPYLRKAHKINPESAYANKMLGAIAVNNGNPERGIRLLEKAREKTPDDAQLLYNLSGAYGMNKNYNKALEILDILKEVNPGFPGIGRWQKQIEKALQRQKSKDG